VTRARERQRSSKISTPCEPRTHPHLEQVGAQASQRDASTASLLCGDGSVEADGTSDDATEHRRPVPAGSRVTTRPRRRDVDELARPPRRFRRRRYGVARTSGTARAGRARRRARPAARHVHLGSPIRSDTPAHSGRRRAAAGRNPRESGKATASAARARRIGTEPAMTNSTDLGAASRALEEPVRGAVGSREAAEQQRAATIHREEPVVCRQRPAPSHDDMRQRRDRRARAGGRCGAGRRPPRVPTGEADHGAAASSSTSSRGARARSRRSSRARGRRDSATTRSQAGASFEADSASGVP
jgi:hypothetical protein